MRWPVLELAWAPVEEDEAAFAFCENGGKGEAPIASARPVSGITAPTGGSAPLFSP